MRKPSKTRSMARANRPPTVEDLQRVDNSISALKRYKAKLQFERSFPLAKKARRWARSDVRHAVDKRNLERKREQDWVNEEIRQNKIRVARKKASRSKPRISTRDAKPRKKTQLQREQEAERARKSRQKRKEEKIMNIRLTARPALIEKLMRENPGLDHEHAEKIIRNEQLAKENENAPKSRQTR
jgi:hypothetical protein